MERYLSEVMGNQLILNSPPDFPLIPEFMIYLLIKPMFGVFTLALVVTFDCLFLGIFQSFHWFVTFIFHKLAPPPEYMFQKML